MTYRSEVVGSLLRPTYLVEARKQLETGELNAADFKALEDRAVNEAISLGQKLSRALQKQERGNKEIAHLFAEKAREGGQSCFRREGSVRHAVRR